MVLYNSFRLIRQFSLISKTEKNMNLHMVTHISIDNDHDCLTSMIWPFTLTAFTSVAHASVVQILSHLS